MKLRVLGNSVRLRLSQTDLATLLAGGAVEESVSFPSGGALRYRLERARVEVALADYRDGAIVLRFPAEAVDRWARPQEVSMRAELSLGAGEVLKLLVEKDFRCLSPRGDEEDADDLFANPGA